jgi:MFS family permease
MSVRAKFCDSASMTPSLRPDLYTDSAAPPGASSCCFSLAHGAMSVRTLDICFSIIFFVASSAASAAYLTVSEIFPLEIRAFAIAIFYAIGTLVGGVGAPFLFGELIASGSRWNVSIGFLIGAALMVLAAGCELAIGVEAAGKSLESVSKPLQSRS